MRGFRMPCSSCRDKDKYIHQVQAKLDAVKKLVEAVAKEFKASTVVPKSAREFLEGMAKDCTAFLPLVRKQIEDTETKIKAELQKAGKKV